MGSCLHSPVWLAPREDLKQAAGLWKGLLSHIQLEPHRSVCCPNSTSPPASQRSPYTVSSLNWEFFKSQTAVSHLYARQARTFVECLSNPLLFKSMFEMPHTSHEWLSRHSLSKQEVGLPLQSTFKWYTTGSLPAMTQQKVGKSKIPRAFKWEERKPATPTPNWSGSFNELSFHHCKGKAESPPTHHPSPITHHPPPTTPMVCPALRPSPQVFSLPLSTLVFQWQKGKWLSRLGLSFHCEESKCMAAPWERADPT